MAMSGRNTRAIHTEDRRIRKNLARHLALMGRFIGEGMTKEDASRKAFRIVTGLEKEPPDPKIKP